MKIKGHTSVVTGASSGLGRATCIAIVEAGGNVIGIDLNRHLINELQSKLGPQFIFVQANVLDSASINEALDAGISRFGAIHCLINCAGISKPKKILSSRGILELEEFSKIVNINLIGTFNVSRLVCARIVKQNPVTSSGERGVVINVSSVAAFDGQVGQASYSASKAAVAGMVLPLARELAEYGIRIVAIAPGAFQTPMIDEASTVLKQLVAQQIPFPKRLGKPEEFGNLCISIIENEYLNGEVLRLDASLRVVAAL